MPKPAKTTPGESSEGDVPFEEALKKLEAIVESMESGELPLEAMLARFEEGARLTEVCQAKLAPAEVRIEVLEKNLAGEATLKPLTPRDE